MQWYYAKENNQFGPVTEDELRAKLAAGEVVATDKVWREGMPDWQPVSAVEPLRVLLPRAAVSMEPGGYSRSPYSPPVAGPPPVAVQGVPTSGLAIASLVCGIVGLVTCFFIPGIAAVICGHMALSRIAESNSRLGGRGMAMVGLVTGYLSVLALVFLVAVVFLGLAASAPVINAP